MNLQEIKTLDILAKEWFDKINGNSYHSVQITVNHGFENEKTIYCPLTYGYGSHYEQTALEAIKDNYPDLQIDMHDTLWRFCDKNNIILRFDKIKGCLKRDVVAHGLKD